MEQLGNWNRQLQSGQFSGLSTQANKKACRNTHVRQRNQSNKSFPQSIHGCRRCGDDVYYISARSSSVFISRLRAIDIYSCRNIHQHQRFGTNMRLFFNLTAIAGLATVGITTAIPGLSKRAENVNIMALGDSITGSPVLHLCPF